jgi:hypothetical protein
MTSLHLPQCRTAIWSPIPLDYCIILALCTWAVLEVDHSNYLHLRRPEDPLVITIILLYSIFSTIIHGLSVINYFDPPAPAPVTDLDSVPPATGSPPRSWLWNQVLLPSLV